MCKLVFLPPYSPDLNPIEQAFSVIKAFLRRNWKDESLSIMDEACHDSPYYSQNGMGLFSSIRLRRVKCSIAIITTLYSGYQWSSLQYQLRMENLRREDLRSMLDQDRE